MSRYQTKTGILGEARGSGSGEPGESGSGGGDGFDSLVLLRGGEGSGEVSVRSITGSVLVSNMAAGWKESGLDASLFIPTELNFFDWVPVAKARTEHFDLLPDS